MSDPTVPTRAQFWGGRFDGEWKAVSPTEQDSKRCVISVYNGEHDDHQGENTIVDCLTEVYLLKYSPTRKQWYFIWGGYSSDSYSDHREEPLD